MPTQYRERPILRKWIKRVLEHNPGRTLEDIARGYYIETGHRIGFFFTDGMRKQARKMIQETCGGRKQSGDV